MAVGLFIFFKEKEAWISYQVNHKVQKLISSVSRASFSIYLIHLLVEMMLSGRTEIEATFLEASLSLIVNISIIFAISYITVKVLNLSKAATYILFGGRG